MVRRWGLVLFHPTGHVALSLLSNPNHRSTAVKLDENWNSCRLMERSARRFLAIDEACGDIAEGVALIDLQRTARGISADWPEVLAMQKRLSVRYFFSEDRAKRRKAGATPHSAESKPKPLGIR
jgi:hypothetical protein